MIEWQEQALVLEAAKFAEHDALVTLLTPTHGNVKAIVKGALSRRHRAGLEPLTLVEANFQARLPEHLGRVTLEIITPYAARVLADPIKLTAISSLATLMKTSLPEHDPHPEIFGGVARLLEMMLHMSEAQHWLPHYIGLEIAILEVLGFGLDLSSCAATGSREDLQYVSPKSGRAVCRAAGAQYAAKLLPLPVFLREGTARPEWSELADGLKMTAHFIEHWLLAAIHRPLPPLRARLSEQVWRMATSRVSA
ncbi:MAG: DNA repair protein RecO [Alphaproteobacteria bacterium]